MQAQQNICIRQTLIHESSTKANYLLAFNLVKTSKHFSKGEFLKESMIETAGILCPKTKNKVEKMCLIDERLSQGAKKKMCVCVGGRVIYIIFLGIGQTIDRKDPARL